MFKKVLLLFTITFAPLSLGSVDDSDDPTIITRSEWGAKPPSDKLAPLAVTPPTYVVIHHGDSSTCTNRAICQAKIRTFQEYHMKTKKWRDIAYNFLVGEDGNIYEGRGWDKAGAHLVDYNNKSIGICFMGNYEKRSPNEVAINAAKDLISYGVAEGKISSSYSLIGHRQAWATTCPGDRLFRILKTWPHWVEKP